jgi:hypothetical protein
MSSVNARIVLVLACVAGCQTVEPPPMPAKLIARSSPVKRAGIFSSAAKPKPSVTGGIESEDAMKQAIDKHVQAGMPLADCQRWFEREGFTWGVYETLPQFGEPDPTLICRRYDPAGFAVSRVWTVSCKVDGERIADVQVIQSSLGP